MLDVGENAVAGTPRVPGTMHTALHDLGVALQNWLLFHGIYTDRSHLLEQLASDQIAWWSLLDLLLITSTFMPLN